MDEQRLEGKHKQKVHIHWDEHNLEENEAWKREANADPNRRRIEEPKTPYERDSPRDDDEQHEISPANRMEELQKAFEKLPENVEPTIVVEEKEKASHHEQFESKRKAHYHGSHLKEALARAYHHEEEDEKDNDEPE